MKIRRLIPAVIAFVILLSAPFSHVLTHDSDPRGGLVCYCCSAMGQKCAMISCMGCCGNRPGDVVDRWAPEMVLESNHLLSPLKISCRDKEISRIPETVYLEVPDKPPKTA